MAYQMLEFPQMSELMEVTTKIETVNEKSGLNGNQPDQNFCQDNNDIPKKKGENQKLLIRQLKLKQETI